MAPCTDHLFGDILPGHCRAYIAGRLRPATVTVTDRRHTRGLRGGRPRSRTPAPALRASARSAEPHRSVSPPRAFGEHRIAVLPFKPRHSGVKVKVSRAAKDMPPRIGSLGLAAGVARRGGCAGRRDAVPGGVGTQYRFPAGPDSSPVPRPWPTNDVLGPTGRERRTHPACTEWNRRHTTRVVHGELLTSDDAYFDRSGSDSPTAKSTGSSWSVAHPRTASAGSTRLTSFRRSAVSRAGRTRASNSRPDSCVSELSVQPPYPSDEPTRRWTCQRPS